MAESKEYVKLWMSYDDYFASMTTRRWGRLSGR